MPGSDYYEALARKVKNKIERIDQTAIAFARTLEEFSDVIDAEYSKVVRLTVLKIYKNIVMRSPVDTGAYRASHGIATGEEPGETENIKGEQTDAELEMLEREFPDLNWKVGDGTIWIYNNQPYAGVLETGHSKQAPHGVYSVALAEFQTALENEIRKARLLE